MVGEEFKSDDGLALVRMIVLTIKTLMIIYLHLLQIANRLLMCI
jgi:hypothetical protein